MPIRRYVNKVFLRMKPYQQWAKRLRLHYGVLESATTK